MPNKPFRSELEEKLAKHRFAQALVNHVLGQKPTSKPAQENMSHRDQQLVETPMDSQLLHQREVGDEHESS